MADFIPNAFARDDAGGNQPNRIFSHNAFVIAYGKYSEIESVLE